MTDTRPRSNRRGVAAVEFALASVVAFSLLLGMVDCSWYMYRHFAAVRAAEHGVRLAATAPVDDDGNIDSVAIQAIAESHARAALTGFGIDPDDARIDTQVTTATSGETVTITVSVGGTELIGFVPVPDTATVTMSQRYEYALI